MADKYLMLFEGKNDRHVVGALLYYYGIAEGIIKFKDKTGLQKLLKDLPIELRASELERLGILIDADTDLIAHWQSLQAVLGKAGYGDIPKLPAPDGTILQTEGLPIVGIWLMPNNKLPGMLEDFVALLVPPEDLLWAKALESVNDIPSEHRRFTANHLSKAYIHTWLAWQEEPGTPLGSAITKRYFDPAASQAAAFISWIRKLYAL